MRGTTWKRGIQLMRLTRAVSHLVTIDKNVAYAAPVFDFKRRQHQLAKLYKAGKYKSETV